MRSEVCARSFVRTLLVTAMQMKFQVLPGDSPSPRRPPRGLPEETFLKTPLGELLGEGFCRLWCPKMGRGVAKIVLPGDSPSPRRPPRGLPEETFLKNPLGELLGEGFCRLWRPKTGRGVAKTRASRLRAS